MKKTDSVMREKWEVRFDKEFGVPKKYEPKLHSDFALLNRTSEESACEMTKESIKMAQSDNMIELYNRTKDFIRHSLAEARREWVEEMRGKVEELLKHPKNGRGNNTPHRWRTGDNCEGCGKDISDRDKRALFCFECAKKRSKETNTQTREKGLLQVLDLLTGDNQLSEHDLELIKEGRAMSDRDTRRGE